MLLDVCIPTFNSGRTLRRCLEAVCGTIRYDKIVICDGHSSDNTLGIAREYGCDIFFYRGRLGGARNVLMKEAKTKWFVFVDSDVLVDAAWLAKVERAVDKTTGAVNGFALPASLALNIVRKPMLIVKSRLGARQRGFTSNTLVRRKAVEGIKLPDISRCEDIILQQKVEERGWKWKIIPAFCRHLKAPGKLLSEASKDFITISRMKNSDLLGALLRL